MVGQLQSASGSDNGKCSRGNRHLACSSCGASIDFQRDCPGADKAVVASDLVCAIRYGDRRHLNGSGFRIVYDPSVVGYDHHAVDNVDREKSGEGDVNGTVLVGNGQRDRNSCRSRACGKGSRTKGECKHDGEKSGYRFSVHSSCLSTDAGGSVYEAARTFFSYLLT